MNKFEPMVVVPRKIHQEIMFYVRKTDLEVSGLGMCDYDPEAQLFTVSEIIFPKQEGSQVETEMDGGIEAEYWFDILEKKPAAMLHWHSHPNFAVTASGTDDELYKKNGDEMPSVGLIFNQKADMSAHFCQTVGVMGAKEYCYLNDIPCYVDDELDADEVKRWECNFQKNFEVKKHLTTLPAEQSQFPSMQPIGGDTHVSRDNDSNNAAPKGEFEDDDYVYHPHYGYHPKGFSTYD